MAQSTLIMPSNLAFLLISLEVFLEVQFNFKIKFLIDKNYGFSSIRTKHMCKYRVDITK